MKLNILLVLLLANIFCLSACDPLLKPYGTDTPTVTITSPPTLTPFPTFTPTPTIIPTPTSTPIGSSGQLILQGYCITNPESCTKGIYKFDLLTGKANLLLAEHQLIGVSPDGKKLILFQPTGNTTGRVHDIMGNILISDLDGSNLYLLTDKFYKSNTIGNTNLAWFPDTDLIAFRSKIDQVFQISIINSDGTDERQVTKSTVGVQSFQPYISNEGIYWDEGTFNTDYGWNWTSLDGNKSEKFGNFHKLSLSPDGKFIAYINTISKPGTIVDILEISSTDGLEIKQINILETAGIPEGEFPPFFEEIFWLPDSKNILVDFVLCNPKCDNYHKVILSSKGEFVKTIETDVNFSLGGSFSPDGRLFYFSKTVKNPSGNGLLPVAQLFDFDAMKTKELDPDHINLPDFWDGFWLPQ